MMYKFLKCTLLIFISSLSTPLYADASNTDDLLIAIAKGVNKLYAHSYAAAQAKLELAKEMLYQTTPGITDTVAANTSQKQPETNNIINKNLTSQLLTTNNREPGILLSLLPGSDYTPSESTINIYNPQQPRTTNPDNIAFNFDALFSTDLSKVKSTDPNMPIKLQELSSYYTRLFAGTHALGIRYPKDQDLLENADFVSYLTDLRQYVAAQSIGLSNLNSILNDRLPIKDLAVAADLPSKNENPDASPAQVSEYMAKRRITNQAWYLNMETAAPTTIMRETLYVLSEMRYEMHQNQILQERLLAAVSAMQLGLLEIKSSQLEGQKNRFIKNKMIEDK